jgi:hypothetical protein
MRFGVLFVLAAVLLCSNAYADQKVYVFPQFADGVYADGTSYRSTITIQSVNTLFGNPINCTLRLFGLTTTFDDQSSGNVFDFTLPVNQFLQLKTLAAQPFASGYASLTCSEAVFSRVTFAYYTPARKMGEATVYAVVPKDSFRLIGDQMDGSKLGVAIANDTDAEKSFELTLRRTDGSTYDTVTIVVGARSRLARFVDEILPSTAGKALEVDIHAADSSNFAVIGLRYTGGVFNTIPAN